MPDFFLTGWTLCFIKYKLNRNSSNWLKNNKMCGFGLESFNVTILQYSKVNFVGNSAKCHSANCRGAIVSQLPQCLYIG